MTESTATSALDSLRWLAGQIDETLEDLMEAHGFGFVSMAATPTEATALFHLMPDWSLVLSKPVEGGAVVRLDRQHGAAAALSLEVGPDGPRTLGEAAGLAISLIAAYGRLGQ